MSRASRPGSCWTGGARTTSRLTGSTPAGAHRGFFGMDPQAADEALKVMSNLKTTPRRIGPPEDPRLVFDVDGLKEEFKTGLVKARKAEFVSRLDEALGDQLPEGTPNVDDVFEDPLKAGKTAIKGLFGGQREKN
jgi:hypothetical protein